MLTLSVHQDVRSVTSVADSLAIGLNAGMLAITLEASFITRPPSA
jgi:hypothetical protein